MKYKVGDKVRIKSLDWYNENKNKDKDKDKDGFVDFSTSVFVPGMSQFCGKIVTIEDVFEEEDDVVYCMEGIDYDWTDEMIEGLVEEEVDLIPKFGEYSDNEPLDVPTMTTEFIKEHGLPCPEGYIFKDENGNVINAQKIILEKKKNEYPKTDDIIKWLRECDMTKYIGVIYSGMCSITFDTEKLIKDITEMMGDE